MMNLKRYSLSIIGFNHPIGFNKILTGKCVQKNNLKQNSLHQPSSLRSATCPTTVMTGINIEPNKDRSVETS